MAEPIRERPVNQTAYLSMFAAVVPAMRQAMDRFCVALRESGANVDSELTEESASREASARVLARASHPDSGRTFILATELSVIDGTLVDALVGHFDIHLVADAIGGKRLFSRSLRYACPGLPAIGPLDADGLGDVLRAANARQLADALLGKIARREAVPAALGQAIRIGNAVLFV